MSADLEATGKAIWVAFGADRLDASAQALVRELARCADVLDRLHDLAIGRREAWASLVFDEMGQVHLSVDRILDEQRKSMIVFKTLYGELRQAGIKPGAQPAPAHGGDDPEDMLAALRRNKELRERQSG